MSLRDKAFSKFKKTKLLAHLRNLTTNAINSEKKHIYNTACVDNCKQNSKNMWRKLKEINDCNKSIN